MIAIGAGSITACCAHIGVKRRTGPVTARALSFRAPRYVGKPCDRAAARHPPADHRRTGSRPGRHRRPGDPEGQPLRHDRRRSRPSPRHRSPPGSHGPDAGRSARTALRCRKESRRSGAEPASALPRRRAPDEAGPTRLQAPLRREFRLVALKPVLAEGETGVWGAASSRLWQVGRCGGPATDQQDRATEIGAAKAAGTTMIGRFACQSDM